MDIETEIARAESESAKELPLFNPVSAADFAMVDVNGLTAGLRRGDRYAMALRLAELSHQAETGGDAVAAHVLRLLQTLMSMHLRVDAEGDPYGVQRMDAERRTALPIDFAGDQAEVLATVAEEVRHPTLRARMADVAYEAGVRRAGRSAVEAYCAVVSSIINGRTEMEFPDIGTRSMDMEKPLERCLMINARIAKRGTLVEPLSETMLQAFDYAVKERAHFAAAKIGRKLLATRLSPPGEIAAAAERLASDVRSDDYHLAIKELWLLAAEAHHEASDEEASRRASVEAIEQTLAMAETVTQSSAKASWVKNALQEYRSLGNARDRIDELRRRLRELQDKALDEYGSFTVPLDGIEELRQQITERFQEMDLAEVLRSIVSLLVIDRVDDIKEDAIRQAREHPLSNIVSSVYTDHDGKEVARGASVDLGAELPESWFKEHGIRNRGIVRRYRVHGAIEPARRAVLERFSINEQHMMPIAAMSSFVPLGHRNIFALGFARLWQGDYVTAGHLLLPQVENSLRHVLQMSGREAAKIEANGIEGDRPLNVLLNYCREDIEAIFGADLVWEMDSLLNFRPGPALRNEVAHGKMSWAAFFSDEAITACWLVYLLTIAPLLPHWENHVVPAMRSATGGDQA